MRQASLTTYPAVLAGKRGRGFATVLGMGTVAPVRPPSEKKQTDGPGSGGAGGNPVSVIVLNDNHNTFEGVAAALADYIPGVDYVKGMALATRIHKSGQATVWRGDFERAELYWEQLKGRGLTMAPLN